MPGISREARERIQAEEMSYANMEEPLTPVMVIPPVAPAAALELGTIAVIGGALLLVILLIRK